MRIKTPNEMTLGQRIVLTFVIVMIILLAFAAYGYFSGAWDRANAEAAKPVDLYQGIPVDEKLLQLDKRALDEAYHQHIIKLWNVWLTDGAREANRVKNGLRISRESYAYAAAQITKREQEKP
jgi:hypothetical protein